MCARWLGPATYFQPHRSYIIILEKTYQVYKIARHIGSMTRIKGIFWNFRLLMRVSQCGRLHGRESLKVVGDSFSVIEWLQGQNALQVPLLFHWMEYISMLRYSFCDISFLHIYWEQNMEANVQSKRGVSLLPGRLFFLLLINGFISQGGSFEFWLLDDCSSGFSHGFGFQ